MEELLTECMIEELTDLQSTAILDSTENVEEVYMCDCTGCIDACTGACEYNKYRRSRRNLYSLFRR